MELTRDIWIGAILGACLSAIVIPGVFLLARATWNWWLETRPARRLLAGIAHQDEQCKIFIRDLVLPQNASVLSVEPRVGIGRVPNVTELWPDVDAKAAADVFNVLGNVGKTRNIEIVRISEDTGQWNSHIVVLGAQANKSFDFYRLMRNVAFRVDHQNIIESSTGEVVPRADGYGYGIILKATNPFKTHGKKGVALLIGGFGTLGTAAAGHYFRENYRELGKAFGRSDFGVLVRASVTGGEQAVERLHEWDRAIKGS